VDCRRATWYNNLMILISTILIHSFCVALPHYIDTDDLYNGYLIPGRSVVIPNVWSVLLCFPSCAKLISRLIGA
jgi:hypothetical protein